MKEPRMIRSLSESFAHRSRFAKRVQNRAGKARLNPIGLHRVETLEIQEPEHPRVHPPPEARDMTPIPDITPGCLNWKSSDRRSSPRA